LFVKIAKSQLRINMFSGVTTTLVNVVLTGVSYPVYLHFLGYEKYGVWIVLFTIINFAQLGNLGLGPAVIKLVAEEHGRQNIEGIQNYITTAIMSLLVSGTITMIAILALKPWLISIFKLTGENAQIVDWLLPYMASLSVYVFIVQALSATLSGLARMDLANYSETFGRVIALGVSILMLLAGFGIVSLLIGNIISYVFVHFATYCLIRRIEKFHFIKLTSLDSRCLKKLLKFGGGMFGGSLISMLQGPFNKLLLSRWLGVSSVSIYEIAFNGAMQVRGLFEACFRAISPEISRVSSNMADKGVRKIHAISRGSIKLIWMIGAPVWLLLIIFISPLLKLWLGERFVDSLPIVFQIMLTGTFLSLLGVPSFYIMIGFGRTKQIFMAYVIQSLVNALVVIVIITTGIGLSLYNVAASVALGMGCATLYLIRGKKLI
jgi:O-antigen/teichoic acid export membrane protein